MTRSKLSPTELSCVARDSNTSNDSLLPYQNTTKNTFGAPTFRYCYFLFLFYSYSGKLNSHIPFKTALAWSFGLKEQHLSLSLSLCAPGLSHNFTGQIIVQPPTYHFTMSSPLPAIITQDDDNALTMAQVPVPPKKSTTHSPSLFPKNLLPTRHPCFQKRLPTHHPCFQKRLPIHYPCFKKGCPIWSAWKTCSCIQT